MLVGAPVMRVLSSTKVAGMKEFAIGFRAESTSRIVDVTGPLTPILLFDALRLLLSEGAVIAAVIQSVT